MAKRYDICGLGNALVDMEYRVDVEFLYQLGLSKGLMTLADESSQQFLLKHLNRAPLKKACGGSAANTLVTATHLRAKTHFNFCVANDDNGHFYLQDIEQHGIDHLKGGETTEISTGTCLVLITEDAERTMSTHLGASAQFGLKQLDQAAIANSQYLYIEGYLLAQTSAFEAIMKAKAIAKQHHTKVAVTFSDPFMIQSFRERFNQLLQGGIDLLFCNELEAQAFCESRDTTQSLHQLQSHTQLVALTQGAHGSLIYDGKQTHHIPPTNVDAIDSNGAGDTYAGILLGGLVKGKEIVECAHLASKCAAKVVTQYGPRLSKQACLDLIA